MKATTGLMVTGLMALVNTGWAANPPATLVMVPPQINYQGRLVTPTNTPYADAVHTIDLTLYPSASGGARLWSERYLVQTRDGYFSVDLGAGGAGLLPTNASIYQVLWRTNNQSPDTFFMALTVRTDQNGNPLTTPTEATPRQQFLTAPFAYRAHQSLYAAKADGLFDAPQGVQTALLSGSDNLTISSLSNITILARTLNFVPSGSTSNMVVNGEPMFIYKRLSGNASTSSSTTVIMHGFDVGLYEVVVVGWNTSNLPNNVASLFVPSGAGSVSIIFSTIPISPASIYVYVLGIRKNLVRYIP